MRVFFFYPMGLSPTRFGPVVDSFLEESHLLLDRWRHSTPRCGSLGFADRSPYFPDFLTSSLRGSRCKVCCFLSFSSVTATFSFFGALQPNILTRPALGRRRAYRSSSFYASLSVEPRIDLRSLYIIARTFPVTWPFGEWNSDSAGCPPFFRKNSLIALRQSLLFVFYLSSTSRLSFFLVFRSGHLRFRSSPRQGLSSFFFPRPPPPSRPLESSKRSSIRRGTGLFKE